MLAPLPLHSPLAVSGMAAAASIRSSCHGHLQPNTRQPWQRIDTWCHSLTSSRHGRTPLRLRLQRAGNFYYLPLMQCHSNHSRFTPGSVLVAVSVGTTGEHAQCRFSLNLLHSRPETSAGANPVSLFYGCLIRVPRSTFAMV
jgi:hypothetical protein